MTQVAGSYLTVTAKGWLMAHTSVMALSLAFQMRPNVPGGKGNDFRQFPQKHMTSKPENSWDCLERTTKQDKRGRLEWRDVNI